MSVKKQGLCLGLLCAAGAVAMRLLAPGDLLFYALALPFGLVGGGLRALSLSGMPGNILAWAAYVLLCAAPLWQGLFIKHRGKAPRHSWMRLLLCASLFFGLYQFINPAGFVSLFGRVAEGEGILISQCMVAGTIWSIAAAWWVLCMLERAGRLALYDGLELLLKIMGALLLIGLCYTRLYELTGAFAPTGVQIYDESGAPITGMAAMAFAGTAISPYEVDWYVIFRSIAQALPAVFLLLLISPALSLTAALRRDIYGEEVASLRTLVAEKAKAAVYACIASAVGGNALQLFFAGSAGGNVHIGVNIPLPELALAFGLLLLADGSRRSRALKLDSDSII